MSRTYRIETRGKKFATVCRTDGYWSITWLSKNRKAAERKGDEFVSGKRTAMRKYVTAYGQVVNRFKSQNPKANKAQIEALSVTLVGEWWEHVNEDGSSSL